LLSFLFVILIALAEYSQNRKRIGKEPKVKTEIDVELSNANHLYVEQLLALFVIKWGAIERKSGKDTVLERVISIQEIVSFNVAITGGIEVSILSTSLRLLIIYNVLIEDAEEVDEFLEAVKADEFLEASEAFTV